MKKELFITIDRLMVLDEGINFLETYTGENAVVGESLVNKDKEKTALFQELSALNRRRFVVMKELRT